MRSSLLILTVVTTLFSSPVAGWAQNKTITVTGFGMKAFEPDWIGFHVIVQLRGPYGEALCKKLNARADSIAGVVRNVGGDACSVSVGRVVEWKENEYRGVREKWRMAGAQLSVQVRLLDGSRFQPIESAIQELGGFQIQIGDHGLLDDSAAMREVTSMAFEDARHQAAEAVKTLGIDMGHVQTVSVNPIVLMEPPMGCGSDYTSAFQRFYGRGELPKHWGRFRVVRKAASL